ncbi:MAG: transporter substrate-binding domain-containing protein [Anaerolineae bacterium]|nr:transporter substrate-binding domain-containing protein [Anaerolineae bacterium]
MNQLRTRKPGWTLSAGWRLALAALILVTAGLAINNTPGEASQAASPTAPPASPTDPPTPSPTDIPSPTPTEAAPTLVPPTPLPSSAQTETAAPITESALARIKADNVLRVGAYFNAQPFTWLNDQGIVAGYEADIIRAIGIELGVEVEFVQVTRHNARDMLLNGYVDLLISQHVLARDQLNTVDFAHPYYLNYEMMVVQEESAYTELNQLAGLPVSVEIGSRSEHALRHWMAQTGVTMDVRTYFTEREALDALALGEVQGMVGELDSLRRAGRQKMRLIAQPVLEEPYAITIRRWDVNLRNVLNRSLQRLKASARMEEIFGEWFPDESINFDDLIPVYDSLYGDARGLAEFNTDMPLPTNPVQARINSGQALRVAGFIVDPNETTSARVRITNAFNQALIEEMARRWNVQIEYLPNSAQNPVDFVANGQADIAIGASPVWDSADRVEYALPYVLHGNRLMVPENSDLTGFADMLGTGWWIGYFADDAADEELIRTVAEIFGISQNIETFAIQREEDAIRTMIVDNNIKAIFGDSLRLLALVREGDNPPVKILDTWYGDVLPLTFAMPRNDADFRALVTFTLQDMARDGTYQRLWAEQFGLGDPLHILAWPDISPDTQP